jgi:BioD-like phosphotransacetylase family protein
MSILLVASAEPRAGRSVIAAALAYRLGRDGHAVTLARLAGDDSADFDARTFASLEGIVSPGAAVDAAGLQTLAKSANVIAEAPPGPVTKLASSLRAKVLAVATPSSPALDALVGTIVTNAPADTFAEQSGRAGVIAVLPEDRVLAAPSVEDIAASLRAEWLVRSAGLTSIGRVTIGTVASDAAQPYFSGREHQCVVTRFDKTDVQLAALGTDVDVLVLTGGGQPSPYVLDRVAGTRDDIAVLLAADDTPHVMRSIEGLYSRGRFDGAAKLARAVELLDEASVNISLA